MRVLGQLVSTWTIERAARAVLRDERIVGAYLDEITRQDTAAGQPVDRVERPRSVSIRERVSRFSDEQLPALILVCPGTTDTPRRDGEGLYSATYAFGVTAVAQATDEDLARELAGILAAAGAAILLHRLPSLDERVTSVRWDGEASDDVTVAPDQRSRAIVTRGLLIGLQDLVCDLSGLPAGWDEADPPVGQPPLDPGALETVLAADVTVTPTDVAP